MAPLVLVTGGNGFIGSHLARALLAAGFRVRIFDLPGTAGGAVADLVAEQAEGSILDLAALDRAMTGVEAVYHLAAKVADWGRPEEFFALNVRGTQNVISAMRRAGARHLVFMSSLAVHGWRDHLNADETEPRDVDPSYPYGWTKRLAEDVVCDAHRRGEIAGTVIRPGFFPFGPWDHTSFAHLARHLPRGYFRLVGRGEKRLCVSYVENLARGMALACLADRAFGETFVLADDGVYAWRDLFGAIADALDARHPRPGPPGSVLYPAAWAMDRIWLLARARQAPPLTRYRVNINRHDFHFRADKAKTVLGYRPEIPFAEGLRRTVEWYRAGKR